MPMASAATTEDWNEGQGEARKIFDALQKSSTQLAQRLGKELGID